MQPCNALTSIFSGHPERGCKIGPTLKVLLSNLEGGSFIPLLSEEAPALSCITTSRKGIAWYEICRDSAADHVRPPLIEFVR